MVSKILFKSDTRNWGTPPYLFDQLNKEIDFDFDAAASPEKTRCANYLTEDDDALSCDWPGQRVFLNPPYGRQESRQWMRKALEEHQKGKTVVCLVPARTCTRWFHDYVYGKAELRFLRGRVKFEGAPNSPQWLSYIEPEGCE